MEPACRVKPQNSEAHVRHRNVKKGVERLDRHSGAGVSGSPKKGGHGGKYTWEGHGESPPPASLDKGDPNYIDKEEVEEVETGRRSGTEAPAMEIPLDASKTSPVEEPGKLSSAAVADLKTEFPSIVSVEEAMAKPN